ncbi:MAG: VCBS repeat-containing protein, partial [Acidobacteria bacterium]|nr:VCBS repeat-containing protein [Acidobacteriota bacterium]
MRHFPRKLRLHVFSAGLTLAFCLAVFIQHFLIQPSQAAAQSEPLWQDVSATQLNGVSGERWVHPLTYRGLRLNQTALAQLLAQAPLERTPEAQSKQLIIEMPLPADGMGRFRFVEAPIMAPALAAKFPALKTYYGQGLDDPTASVRFDVTLTGFHAMILSAGETTYIDPLARGNADFYLSYAKHELRKPGWAVECFAQSELAASPAPPASPFLTGGTTLRTYRLALAATGEYTAFHGGTVAGALSAMVTSMNRVNGVYEREVAVRMVLVANNDSVIFTNAATDPYTNSSGSTMLGQNQTTLDSVIGAANYDIGHVFSTGGGGVASLRSVCVSGSKARGVTGNSAPVGDGFDIDYVAHEMGHQFGGNHTFNGTTGSCSGNRAAAAAYETGSGSTIMAYAGICGAEDLQPHSDDYFHAKSLEEIYAFINGTGGGCAVATGTSNNPPTVNAGASFTIPAQTPFALTASGSDVNGDTLSYCWEQYDLGTAAPPNTDNGNRPIMRSYNPTTGPTRTIPRLADLLANTSSVGEALATTTRTLNFRVIARDNRAGGGGIQDATLQVFTRADAGPFVVTAPNTPVTIPGGTAQLVTWNVANTNVAPVSCSNVKITLSTNGGQSFPIVLAGSALNNGSAIINIPNLPTTQARLKVEALGNIFFDISNTNFTITSGGGGGIVRAKKADFDGDGKTDLSIFSPNTIAPTPNWTVFNSSNSATVTQQWGAGYAPYNDVIVPGDYDGDGKTDHAIWRGADSIWYIRKSSDGGAILDLWGANYAPYFDIPVPGDYDNDGKTDLAVWRRDGTWYVKRSSNGSFLIQVFGQSGDVPVPADYDGDGQTDLAVFRPDAIAPVPNWIILNSSTNTVTSLQWGAGYAPYFDTPVPADYDGDGKADLAFWRGADSIWYIRPSANPGSPMLDLWGANYAPYFDIPTPGDYDGDGKADIAVWRRSGTWFVKRSSNGS